MLKALSDRLSLLLICTLGCFTASTAQAQITSDGTVNTQVNQNGNVAEITGGATRGNNLFHSFQEFSIQTGNEAFFNNADSINNIFSRVTGGNISNIDGLIRANGDASLFLINPAGIIFGENARLDIGGSFYGSSASSILFPDGEFSAVENLAQPVLTINAPIGLNFRDEPGAITNRSNADEVGLSVNQGQNISLLGGNVNIENGGIVFAPGGTVNLGGLLATGTISFTENNSLSFPENVVRGNVSLTDSSIVAVFSSGGGAINVNAANLELTSGSNILAGIDIDAGSKDAQAGNITINTTEDILVDAAGEEITQISNTNFGTGNAGNIEVNARNISFINGGAISSFNTGQGNTGNILVNATGDIVFDGITSLRGGIINFANEEAIGEVGNINL